MPVDDKVQIDGSVRVIRPGISKCHWVRFSMPDTAAHATLAGGRPTRAAARKPAGPRVVEVRCRAAAGVDFLGPTSLA